MGPVAYFIAILGCSDGSAACQQVATLTPQYASEAECSAATTSVLSASTDLDFPTIVAECRAAKARPAAVKEQPEPRLTGLNRRG